MFHADSPSGSHDAFTNDDLPVTNIDVNSSSSLSAPATYLMASFYENPQSLATREHEPMGAVDSRKFPQHSPLDSSRFWVSPKACPGWGSIIVGAGRTAVRELALISQGLPPAIENHQLINILLNIYDKIEQQVGPRVMSVALSNSLSFALTYFSLIF
jgi:hypothetical protein